MLRHGRGTRISHCQPTANVLFGGAEDEKKAANLILRCGGDVVIVPHVWLQS